MYGCIGQDFCAVDYGKPLMPVNVCRVTIPTTICMLCRLHNGGIMLNVVVDFLRN